MDEEEFRENAQAIQAHLGILQSAIHRIASNSAASKTACITLVSAILVIVADKGKPNYAWIALIPTLLFFILDAYYLGLEKGFRNAYNEFIGKLHKRTLAESDMYVVAPKGNQALLLLQSTYSFSVWPFYLTLLGMIYVAYRCVL